MSDQKSQMRELAIEEEYHHHVQALTRLTDLARLELPPPSSVHDALAAYERLVTRVPRLRLAERVPRLLRGLLLWLPAWFGLPVAAAAMALVVALGVWGVMLWRPVGLIVDDGTVDEAGVVHAVPAGQPSLHFSDGTEVNLGSSSRARVTERTRHGARVLLEEGRAQAQVVPRRGAEWVFDAGPCRINVTGTRFDMRWSSPEQVLEVRLYHGSVVVKGPPALSGVPMRAGQRLVMDVRQGSVRLTDLPSASTITAVGAPGGTRGPGEARLPPASLPVSPGSASMPSQDNSPAPPAAPGLDAPASGATSSGLAGPAAGAHRGETWPARVLAGEFRAVIDEARRRGIDDVLRNDSAASLMALADAARYAGASSLAERSLLKVRARFPRSGPAHRAAFLLGRMAEDQEGNLGDALRWYETYLTDVPDDGFRAEAMGRRMTATLRVSGAAQARDLAAEYLRHYPQGAYAKAARAILSQ
jgi:TolA-binding protein